MTPFRAQHPFDWPGLLALIQRAFAGMEGRIDPPSSLHRLTPTALADPGSEVWVIGTPPVACVVLTEVDGRLHVGKLAVEPSKQGRGHARRLVALAADRARALGLTALELQVRVELVENHAVFRRLGFLQVAATAHAGYDRVTSLTFRKLLQVVMPDPVLLGIPGALRAASTNRLLLAEARRLFGDATHTEADLRLPLLDEDLEIAEGIPSAVQRLADQIKAADAIIIATPEYNKALPGVLKNALDWVSRTKGGPWRDKPVAIMSAADGRAGGERSQFSLRLCLMPFRARVLPGPEVMVAQSHAAFDADGRLTDARTIKELTELMGLLREAAARASKS